MSEGKCFCHLNGYEVKDAAARQKLIEIDGRVESLESHTGNTGNVEIRLCVDCDAALTDGFYRLAVPAANVPSDDFTANAVLLVQANENTVYQTITDANLTAKRFYNVGTGTWSEWEWENPPYTGGIVYRTTERFRGFPVYAVSIPCGMAVHGSTQVSSANGIVDDPEFAECNYEWTIINYEGYVYDAVYVGDGSNFTDKTGEYPLWGVFSSIKANWSAEAGLKLTFEYAKNSFMNTGEGDANVIVKFIKDETGY